MPRQREGERGVQDGELREHLVPEHVPDLPIALGIADHRAAVHLRTGADHGQDAAHGDDLVIWFLHPDKELFLRKKTSERFRGQTKTSSFSFLLSSRLYCRLRNFTESCHAGSRAFTAGRESHPAPKIFN